MKSSEDRPCNSCIWSTRDGGCSSWDCMFIDKREAYKAWVEKKEREREKQAGDSV